MKKLVIVALALLLLTGCSVRHEPAPELTPELTKQYTAYGRYYTDGFIITEDGNEWGYDADVISDKTPYDKMPVWVAFDNNGTPDDIYDDIVLGLVFDRNTAVYDDLERELSESFEVERDGNNLKIAPKEVR